MKICSAIINLFHLIPAAPQTLVKPLLEVVMKTERAMLIEVKAKLGLVSFFLCLRQAVFSGSCFSWVTLAGEGGGCSCWLTERALHSRGEKVHTEPWAVTGPETPQSPGRCSFHHVSSRLAVPSENL